MATTGKTTKATAAKPATRVETPEANRDVVAAVSRRADGTPDQTPGYVVIGEARDTEDEGTPKPGAEDA